MNRVILNRISGFLGLAFGLSILNLACQTVSTGKDEALLARICHEMVVDLESQTEAMNWDWTLWEVDAGIQAHLEEVMPASQFVFYFSNIHCSECVHFEAMQIRKNYNPKDILIVSQAESIRALKVFKHKYLKDYQVYYISPAMDIGKRILDLPAPVYFQRSSAREMIRVFRPVFSYPELSDQYHQIMKNLIIL